MTVDANESLEAAGSDVIVTGFDSGDGLAIRLAASVDEPRAGILTNLGASWFPGDVSVDAFEPGDCEEVGAGFEGAMDPLASRLAAWFLLVS